MGPRSDPPDEASMSTVDPSKGVWKVTGHLPAPDGRRMTVFCNADSEPDARGFGHLEGLATVERVTFHPPEEIARWEALAANTPPTHEEVERAR